MTMRVALALCGACAAAAAAGVPPTTGPLAQPGAPLDAAAIARAERLVREVFAADYGAGDNATRRALAARLLAQAASSGEEPAVRFVLLREARDIAARAGDPETSFRAITQLTAHHALDPVPMAASAMTAVYHATGNPDALDAAARICMNMAGRAVMRDDYASARGLLSLAAAAARKAQHAPLLALVETHLRMLARTEKAHAQYRAALEALRTDDANASAHLAAGRFLCFCKTDWEGGLAHLARGSDAAVAELARLDRSAPADAPARYELAGRWWDLAIAEGAPFAASIEDRAAHWYRLASPGLSGLPLAAARKRLEQVEARVLRERNLAPGLLAELYRGSAFEELVRTRVDPRIDFDWGDAAPDESLPRDMFSIRWRGVLRVTTPGRYQFAIVANAGAKLWIDGNCIIDAPDLARRRSGARADIELGAELHSLRVDYWDTTGLARMRLLWRPPARNQDEPVPSEALYHDALWRPR